MKAGRKLNSEVKTCTEKEEGKSEGKSQLWRKGVAALAAEGCCVPLK